MGLGKWIAGAQIKERRKALKITQQELADLAGISINTVVATESDSREFSFIYDRAYLLGGLHICLNLYKFTEII